MSRYFRVQTLIATIGSLFGLSMFLVNLLLELTLRQHGINDAVKNSAITVPLVSGIIFYLSRNLDFGFIRGFHFTYMVVFATIATLDAYDSFYGLGFFMLAALTAYKYGFLNRAIRLKIAVGIIYLFVLIEFAVQISNSAKPGVSADVIVYLLFFISIVYAIYKEDIDRIVRRNENLTNVLSVLNRQRVSLESRLSEMNAQIARIEEMREATNLSEEERRECLQSEFRLTEREFRTVMLAYDTGETNQYLSEQLGIKAGTVKQHLHRAFGKMDIRTRSDMFTMIRDYVPPAEMLAEGASVYDRR